MANTPFELNLNETFTHLANPPIVEAIIHWQARTQKPFDETGWKSALSEKLPGYRTFEPIQRFDAMMTIQDDGSKFESQRGVDGLRLTSDDKLHIIQFKRDGVVFSRLQPYRNWQSFTDAAMPAWRAFVEIAEPLEIQRLGVRFINHLPAARPDSLDSILREPPTRPANLLLNEFVYQSTFAVPDHPFAIRVIKLMQPSVSEMPQSSGLFLDCDVFTTKPIVCDEEQICEALIKMRWLKNKIFFSLLSDPAWQSFV